MDLIDEIMEEYKNVPLEKKEKLSGKYAEELRAAGMPEDEIEYEINGWLSYDETSELMNRYGVDTEEELNDLMESNDIFPD